MNGIESEILRRNIELSNGEKNILSLKEELSTLLLNNNALKSRNADNKTIADKTSRDLSTAKSEHELLMNKMREYNILLGKLEAKNLIQEG